jgi:hypothetical protein
MHDYHAVAALIERIASQTEDLERVTEVRIRADAAFSPETLQQAYAMLTLGTALAPRYWWNLLRMSAMSIVRTVAVVTSDDLVGPDRVPVVRTCSRSEA